MEKKRTAIFATALALAASLASACGDSPASPEAGSVQAFLQFAIMGDAVGAFSGSGSDPTRTSHAVVTEVDGADGFFLVEARSVALGSPEDDRFSLLLGPVDGPGEFALPVPPPPSSGFVGGPSSLVLAGDPGAPETVFVVTGGALTVTEVADGWMRGTFTATAERPDGGAGDVTTLELSEGRFRLRIPGGSGG